MTTLADLPGITTEEIKALRHKEIKTGDDLWISIGGDVERGTERLATGVGIRPERLMELLCEQSKRDASRRDGSRLRRHWPAAAAMLGALVLIAIGVTTPRGPRAPSPAQVVARDPVVVTQPRARRAVLFAWRPFPRAAIYALHVWMIAPGKPSALAPGTPLTFSTAIYRGLSYTWTDRAFPPGAYRYSLLPFDAHGRALAPWSPSARIVVGR